MSRLCMCGQPEEAPTHDAPQPNGHAIQWADEHPAPPPVTPGSDQLREAASRLVTNWRVNFPPDDDESLTNMIHAAVIGARLSAITERDRHAAQVQRVEALVRRWPNDGITAALRRALEDSP